MRMNFRQLSIRAISTAPIRSAAEIQSLNQQVDRYSRYSPSPLSVQQFLDFGQCKFRGIIFSGNHNFRGTIIFGVLTIFGVSLFSGNHQSRKIVIFEPTVFSGNQKIRGLAAGIFEPLLFSGNQQFNGFSANSENNEIKSVEYLRYELPTRLANMLKEMNRLPKELLGLFKIPLIGQQTCLLHRHSRPYFARSLHLEVPALMQAPYT